MSITIIDASIPAMTRPIPAMKRIICTSALQLLLRRSEIVAILEGDKEIASVRACSELFPNLGDTAPSAAGTSGTNSPYGIRS
jgi:hypothetical protein